MMGGRFNRKYIVNLLTDALHRGTSPRKLALTCALGFVLGIFPVWGTTTWICFALAFLLRLNVIILQMVNYLVFPLQMILIVPFITAGTFVFNLQPLPYTQTELMSKFRTDFWGLAREAGLSLGSGVAVWAIAAVPVFLIVFYSTFIFFQSRRQKTHDPR
jgi:uncharacterized protein (DUF2062 family)